MREKIVKTIRCKSQCLNPSSFYHNSHFTYVDNVINNCIGIVNEKNNRQVLSMEAAIYGEQVITNSERWWFLKCFNHRFFSNFTI